MKHFSQEQNQIILHTDKAICTSKSELIHSDVFQRILRLYTVHLHRHHSAVLASLPEALVATDNQQLLQAVLAHLCELPLEKVPEHLPQAAPLLQAGMRKALHQFAEGLYDYWRTFDRFLVLHAEPGPSSFDQRPYRAFNATAEELTHLVRAVYRDICENIIGDHPRVYRQVAAGFDVALIAVPAASRIPPKYQAVVGNIPVIRQVWITPPLIIDPPMNKRTGEFLKIDRDPLAGVVLAPDEWLCYPAQVGPLVVFIYFHQRFMGLGCSLANLFELATDQQVQDGPDAIYTFGLPLEALAGFGALPTVFFDDEADQLLVAAVPNEDRFGYFGYIKKMVLTLHNIAMMKKGRMPYHGAMVRISLKNGRGANLLIIGDTATGKSETLEAFRLLGDAKIRDMHIVADDMGSLEIDAAGRVIGYGTEIGAFIRLDDLQQGYAFSQIDRAVIMSPQKINARVVLPVTTPDEVLHGYAVDFLLYANNYEEVDQEHPLLDRMPACEKALQLFREGAAMAKGTTTSTGLVHSYFANIFGPPQYRELHERIASSVFQAAFAQGVWVGQLRTRLGIPGFETRGPQAAAEALLELLETACGDPPRQG